MTNTRDMQIPNLPGDAKVQILERDPHKPQEWRVAHEQRIHEQKPVKIDPFHFLERKTDNDVRYRTSLTEALLTQPDAGNLLRDGIRTLAFQSYDGMALTYQQLVQEIGSMKPEEYYLRTSPFGRLGRSPSGEPAPELGLRLEGNARIENHLYRGIFTVLGDDIKFDRIGLIQQIAQSMGTALRITEEAEVYDVITNTANYTRSNTTNDNDVGANTAALDLTHVNLESALARISTAKDRHTGMYLGCMADTIIVGPLMAYPVQKLLNSERMITGTDAQYGDLNVYRGAISRIVVSPFFSDSYDWALMDSRVSYLMFQRVESPQVYQEGPAIQHEEWLKRDAIRFLARTYFGVGFADDRGVAYFRSSTRPTL